MAKDIRINIASTEYTPYYDLLKHFNRKHSLVTSSEGNLFTPGNEEYFPTDSPHLTLALLSNPCNPTGITRDGRNLKSLVDLANTENRGLLIDEAYEIFHDQPVSAMEFIDDINESNHFVIGAATKDLQDPGIRIGWAISSKQNVGILGNFLSFGMGGISHLSQSYAVKLFKPEYTFLSRISNTEVLWRTKRSLRP